MRRVTKMACLCVIAGVALTSQTALAQEKFRVIGVGVEPCSTWTTDRQDPNSDAALLDADWVVAFLSGIGYSTPDNPLKSESLDSVSGWVDNYCSQNPGDTIEEAAVGFYKFHPN